MTILGPSHLSMKPWKPEHTKVNSKEKINLNVQNKSRLYWPTCFAQTNKPNLLHLPLWKSTPKKKLLKSLKLNLSRFWSRVTQDKCKKRNLIFIEKGSKVSTKVFARDRKPVSEFKVSRNLPWIFNFSLGLT